MLRLLIHLFWLFYSALYFGSLTVPHKTPLSGARRFKGPRADFVPVLGRTPTIATLLGKRTESSGVRGVWRLGPHIKRKFEYWSPEIQKKVVNKPLC